MLDEGELAITEVLQVLQDLRLPPAVKPAGRIGVLRKSSMENWGKFHGTYGQILLSMEISW